MQYFNQAQRVGRHPEDRFQQNFQFNPNRLDKQITLWAPGFWFDKNGSDEA